MISHTRIAFLLTFAFASQQGVGDALERHLQMQGLSAKIGSIDSVIYEMPGISAGRLR